MTVLSNSAAAGGPGLTRLDNTSGLEEAEHGRKMPSGGWLFGSRQRMLIAVLVAVSLLCVILFSVLMWSVTRDPSTAYSEGFVSASAALRANMDPTAEPCEDFYQYACGGWMKRNVIPDDMEQWSNFVILRDKTLITIWNLMTDLQNNLGGPPPAYLTKLLGFYGACTNTTAMDADPADQLKDLVDDILAAGDGDAALEMVAKKGVQIYFYLYSDPDSRKPDKYSLYAVQGVLGMPLKEQYDNSTTNPEVLKRQENYRHFVTQLWELAGKDKAEAGQIATSVYELEECIAEGMKTPTEERQASDERPSYPWSKVSTENTPAKMKLKRAVEARLKSGVTVPAETQVSFFDEYMNQTNKCLVQHTESDPTFEKEYIATRVMLTYAASGKEAWRDVAWENSMNITGVEQKQPLWKSCISLTQTYLPETIGRVFANETFKPDAKESTLTMIGDIKTAFKQLLPKLEWMDDDTRTAAEEKAVAVDNKIGYPDWIMDDEKLGEYLDFDLPGDKLGNIWSLDEFLTAKDFSVLGLDVDKGKWYMSPATVNAYYNPKGNEMVFPAAILQPPFYRVDYPKYVNYGAIGVVIGHELTHGFDDSGRKFDKDGVLNEWYTKQARDGFEKRAKCMSDQYSTYSVMGYPVDGGLTLGENIADNGGVKQAYIAYQNWVKDNGEEAELPGMGITNEQAFFLSYAQIWCQKKTKSAFEVMTKTDPHSPGMFRIKGPLVNSNEFAAAYQCPTNSPMNPPKSEKCEVW